jgi:NTE family protein
VWPERGYACTAVDAHDGSSTLWDRSSGVSLARAVASSCSVPGIYPPITLNGRRYIDGGMRSATNADLATGHERVVVVAVMAGGRGSPAQERQRERLEAELRVLRDAGSRVELIAPDAASLKAFGPNLMDPAQRTASARAGLAQGRAVAQHLASFWPSP